MRRFWFAPAVVGISAMLLAQSSAPSASKRVSPASVPCTVTGRVVTAAGGNALKSARVALVPEHYSGSLKQIYATTSDSDGRFTLNHIPPGRYRLFATHAGFVDQHYKAGTNNSGLLFSLTRGDKVSDVVLRLIAAAVITGRVTNEDGDPMPELQVMALRPPSDEELEDEILPGGKTQMEPVASVETDDRGQYRIFGLKPDQYYIRVEDSLEPSHGDDENDWLMHEPGSTYASVFYPGVSQISQAQAVAIKPGEEAQADLVMRRVKSVEVAGNVIGAAGPVARAWVRLEYASGFGFSRDATTDEKGSFRLRNVPDGTYYILAGSQGIYALHGRQKIEVIGDNIESLTITLGVRAPIQGRLKVDGANSIALDQIWLRLMPVRADGEVGRSTAVKQDGSFEITAVPDGTYAIDVTGLDRGVYVKSARRGPDNLLEKGLQVEGNSTEKVEVIIGSGGAQLEGSVIANDQSVIGAEMRLAPDPLTPYNRFRIRRTTTDQMLHFSFTDVAPGKYKLTARPMLSSEGSSFKSEPKSITLSDNDHKMIEIKLERRQE